MLRVLCRSATRMRAREVLAAAAATPAAELLAFEAKRAKRLRSILGEERISSVKDSMAGFFHSGQPPADEKIGDFFYFTVDRESRGREYTVVCRYKTNRAKAEVVLDPVSEGLVPPESLDTFNVTRLALSADQRLLAALIDLENNERPICVFKRLGGRLLTARLRDCSALAFAAGGQVVYTKLDESGRPSAAFLHQLGAKQADDQPLLVDEDPRSFLDVAATQSREFLVVSAATKRLRRFFIARASDPAVQLRPIFEAEDCALGFNATPDFFVFVTMNGDSVEAHAVPRSELPDASENFDGFCKAFSTILKKKTFLRFVSEKEETLTEFDVSDKAVVLYLTSALKPRVIVVPLDASREATQRESERVSQQQVKKQQEDFQKGTAGALGGLLGSFFRRAPPSGEQLVFEAPTSGEAIELPLDQFGVLCPQSNLDGGEINFTLENPITPPINYRISAGGGRVELLRRGSSRSGGFALSRVNFPSTGGVSVPMLMAHPQAVDPTRPTPGKTLLRSYGVYEMPSLAFFSQLDLSFLRAGYRVAWPMIRGSTDLGAAWRRSALGRLKRRSIEDLDACARFLLAEGWTFRGGLAGFSHSAGAAILASAAMTPASPFSAMVLASPFLNVEAGLGDPEAPLAQSDWDEFGDPRVPEELRTIRSVCPTRQLDFAKNFPATLLLGYKNDFRTPFEPLLRFSEKWRRVNPPTGSPQARKLKGNVWVSIEDGAHEGPAAPNLKLEEDALIFSFVDAALEEEPYTEVTKLTFLR